MCRLDEERSESAQTQIGLGVLMVRKRARFTARIFRLYSLKHQRCVWRYNIYDHGISYYHRVELSQGTAMHGVCKRLKALYKEWSHRQYNPGAFRSLEVKEILDEVDRG
jgi:hypothetical protein